MTEGARAQPDLFVALGIPQGLLYSASNHDFRGFVRRGGDFVELTPETYTLWVRMLSPQTIDDLRKWWGSEKPVSIETVLRNMGKTDMLLKIRRVDSASAEILSKIRLLPIGMGWISNGENVDSIEIASPEGLPQLRLDPISFAIWSLCDGLWDLLKVCSYVSEKYGLELQKILDRAIDAVLALMSKRLAYIDKIRVRTNSK